MLRLSRPVYRACRRNGEAAWKADSAHPDPDQLKQPGTHSIHVRIRASLKRRRRDGCNQRFRYSVAQGSNFCGWPYQVSRAEGESHRRGSQKHVPLSTSQPVLVVVTASELLPFDRNLLAFAVMDISIDNNLEKHRLVCLIDARWLSMPTVWIATERASIFQGDEIVDLDAWRPSELLVAIQERYAAGLVGWCTRTFVQGQGRSKRRQRHQPEPSRAHGQPLCRGHESGDSVAPVPCQPSSHDAGRRVATFYALGEEHTGPTDTSNCCFAKTDF